MATVRFTNQLERFVRAPTVEADGDTLAEVFEAVFWENPRLRTYIVDEQFQVRRHVAVFVNGEQIKDRGDLNVPVGPKAEIYVFQALSGG